MAKKLKGSLLGSHSKYSSNLRTQNIFPFTCVWKCLCYPKQSTDSVLSTESAEITKKGRQVQKEHKLHDSI